MFIQDLKPIVVNVDCLGWHVWAGTLGLGLARGVIFVSRFCWVVGFRWRPIRDIGGFCRGLIETQGFFLAKDLEFSLALLLNPFDAAFDYGRGRSNLDRVCDVSDDRNKPLYKFEGSK